MVNHQKNPTSILQIYDEILTFNRSNNLRLFSLLPLKQSFNMSYITLDKTGLQDLIVQDELLQGKKGDVREFMAKNPLPVFRHFFNIQQYESKKKKFIFFKKDGVSVSVVLEYEEKQGHLPTKRKWNDNTAVSSTDYGFMVGIDPGLRYVFLGKSDDSIDKKKSSIRMSSKQYYYDCKFNWKTQKQKCCYKNKQTMEGLQPTVATCHPIKQTTSMSYKSTYAMH
jgi:hypothetical protein